jgi:methionine-R-sulfoxide reductase
MKRALFFVALCIAAIIVIRVAATAPAIPYALSMTGKAGEFKARPPHPYYARVDTSKFVLADSVWKRVLPLDVFDVARHGKTERPFTGRYWNYNGKGVYFCALCGNKLFWSDAKFKASSGWPSFYEPAAPTSITIRTDLSYGMVRTEVLCTRCGAHLGHLFEDGPPPTGKRFSMNSVVLDFEPLEASR